MKYYIGVDIGGTKCAVTLGGCEGEDIRILDKSAFPTEPRRGVERALGLLREDTGSLLRRNGLQASDIARVGISCGGPLNSRSGVILSPPNLIGWDHVEITRFFEESFGIPASLQNDANACALAEWLFGAGRGYSSLIFITFGTGFGAGLILDGRLYSGASDMAGEIGHVRLEGFGPVGYGKMGSLEGFCSGGGIAQLARAKALEKLQRGEAPAFCENAEALERITAKSVAEAARAGDSLAREIYRVSGTYLGRGLSLLVDVLNPELIIIGSIFARDQELLWPPAREVMETECLVHARHACKVVSAELGESLGDYAAIAVAVRGGGEA